MSVIIRTARLLPKSIISSRNFNTTVPYLVKEINERTENNALVVEGVNLPSPRAQKLLKEVCQSKFCPECTLGLEIKHTDVLILSQYVRSDGCMLPQRITGLCRRQQKRIAMMVTMAQKAGLMSNLTPANSKKDPKRRFAHKKFNTYFLESTIKY